MSKLLKRVLASSIVGFLLVLAGCGSSSSTGGPALDLSKLNGPATNSSNATNATSPTEQAKWLSDMLKVGTGVKNGENGLDANNLTTSDYQALGITLSNYYIPFGTDVKGDLNTKASGASKTQQLLINKLTSNTGFKMDKDIATTIVNTVLGNVQHQSKTMNFAYCRVNPNTKKYAVNPSLIRNAKTQTAWGGLKMNTCVLDGSGDGQTPVTYWSLMAAATGEMRADALKDAAAKQKDGKPSTNKDNIAESALAGKNVGYDHKHAGNSARPDPEMNKATGIGVANTIVAYVEGSSGRSPMFTASADASVISPSVLSLMEILKRSNPAAGWGNARTTLSNKDDVKDGDMKTLLANVGDAGKYDLQYATAPLVVSPFGDLAVDGQWTMPIIMPAADNPLIYSAVDGSGAVNNDLNGGVFYSNGSYTMSTDVLRLNDADGCSSLKSGISTTTRCGNINLEGGNNSLYSYIQDGTSGINPGNIENLTHRDREPSAVNDRAGFQTGAWIINTLAAGQTGDSTGTYKSFFGLTDKRANEQALQLASVYQDYAKAHPDGVLSYINMYNNGKDYKRGDGNEDVDITATTAEPWFRYVTPSGNWWQVNMESRPYSSWTDDDKSGATFWGNGNNPVITNDNMLFFDNLNLLQYGSNDDSATKDPQSAIDLYNVIQEKDGSGKLMCSVYGVFKGGSCTNTQIDGNNTNSLGSSDFDPTATNAPTPNGYSTALAQPSDKVMTSLFLTFTVASSPSNSNTAARLPLSSGEIKGLGYILALGNLPAFSNTATFNTNAAPSVTEEQQNILDWTWYFLNPSKISYKMQVLSASMTSILIGWHNAMLGTNGVGNMMGTTKYSGFVGYTQLPDLNTMSFTAQLAQLYQNSLLYIILLIFLISCCFVVTNTVGIQKAAIAFLAFAILAALPVTAVNAVSGGVNTLADSMYSGKMMYWGITQQQATMEGAEKAAMSKDSTNAAGDVASYLNSIYGSSAYNTADSNTDNSSSFSYNSQGGNDITVRWQAAKKLSSVTVSNSDGFGNTDMDSTMSTLVNNAGNAAFSGQSDVSGDDDFLYRGYSDIGNYAKYIYGDLTGTGSPTQVPTVQNPDTSWWTDSGLKKNYANMYQEYQQYVKDGYLNGTKAPVNVPNRYVMPFGSNIYKNGVTRYTDMSKLQPTQVVGINSQCLTGMSMASLNAYSGEDLGAKGCANADKYGNAASDGAGASNADYGSLAAYSLMSESPFFWEAWTLYDTGMNTNLGTSGSFKDIILRSSNGSDPTGFFYNSANGEMKDYLDLRGLFTYYMPYARMGNKIANEYFKMYGSKIYDGISTDEGKESEYKDNPTQLSEYYHNMNVLHAYEMYTPWVGIIDSSSYAKATDVSVNGQRESIANPTDPAEYPADRPMVFSKSEQIANGIRDSQLTSVEKKIQAVEKNTSDDYLKLLNYYNYNDGVLTTAAAMQFTFNFNREFSENGFLGLGKGAVLYPQGFEVGNFSYDSYLRLMIMNTNQYASAAYAQKNQDKTEAGYYAQIVENSSPTLAALFVLSDIISIYFLPALKLFLIIGLFLLFLIELFLNIFSQGKPIWRKIKNNIGMPLLIVALATLGMDFCIKLLMSDGLTGVTGGTNWTLNLGDPAITVFVITIIDAVFAAVFGYQAIKLGKNIYIEGKTAGAGVVSMAATLASAVGAGVGSMFKGQGFSSGFKSKTGGSNGMSGSGYSSSSNGNSKSSRSTVNIRHAEVQMKTATRRRRMAQQAAASRNRRQSNNRRNSPEAQQAESEKQESEAPQPKEQPKKADDGAGFGE